jgi:hypothetical protein
MYDSLAVETQEPAVVRRFASILILLLIATLPTHASPPVRSSPIVSTQDRVVVLSLEFRYLRIEI